MTENACTIDPIGFVLSPLTRLEAAPLQGDEGAPEAWLELREDFGPGSWVCVRRAPVRELVRGAGGVGCGGGIQQGTPAGEAVWDPVPVADRLLAVLPA